MLTKEQVSLIATKLNADINIPLLPESMEQVMLEFAVQAVVDQLDKVLPPPIKKLLEELDPGEILASGGVEGFVDRLIQAINTRVDIPYLSEDQEEKIIRLVVELIVESMSGTESLDKRLNA